MRKLNEFTRKYIDVVEIDTVFRTSDNIAYSVYKDHNGKYYIDAYDAAPSVAEFNGDFADDAEAIAKAQEYIDSINN